MRSFIRQFRGAAEDHTGLICRERHPHSAAAACRQHRAAGDSDRAVCVQRLVVRGVGRPNGHIAAGDRQIAVGIKAVAAVGAGRNRSAVDVQRIGKVGQVGVCGVDAVVCGLNVDAAGKDIDGGALQSLVAGGDGHAGTGRSISADVQGVVAVQCVIPRREGEGAALHIQRRLRVHRVVHRCVDVQRQLPDGQGRLAVRRCGPGLDAVLAVRLHVQRSRAAEHGLRAVLALDDGVFCVGIAGFVVVALRIRQRVFRPCGDFNGDLASLAADDGGGGFRGERQPVQHQRHAVCTLFHRHAAIGATAVEHIGAGIGDGQIRSVDLHAVCRSRRDLTVAELNFRAADGCGILFLVGGAAREQTQSKRQRKNNC